MGNSRNHQNQVFNFDFEYSTISEVLRGRGVYKRGSCPPRYASIELEISPLENSKTDFQLIWSVDENTIPAYFAAGVIQGIGQWCAASNFKDLRIEVVGGLHHEVDSTESAFMYATQLALNDAFKIKDESRT